MTIILVPPSELPPLSSAERAQPTSPEPPDVPRPLRSRTFDDKATIVGSALASLAFTWLVYENLLPFDGALGFVICWFISYLAFYIGTSSITNTRAVLVDRATSTIVHGLAALTGAALVTAVVFPFVRGYHLLYHPNFYVHDMAGVGPRDPFNKGGVFHAIVGSLIEIGIAVVVTLPLGVGTAVYLTEVGGRLAKIVRTVVEAMTALPSIIAGLFIYTVLIVELHWPKDGFAAAMALSVMGLPIIARASEVVLRVVPGGLREASQALGASRWQTVWRVVLPTARPGLATALILGIARMVGETSPVLLTSGASTFLNTDPFSAPMNSLPLFIYFAVRSGEPEYIARGFGAACVLITIVLLLFITARLVARRRPGR